MAVKGKYVYEWPRPMVTTDALVFGFDRSDAEAKVLLINRGQEPYKGCWAVPGGFLEMDEDLHKSAERELYEETGLTGIKLAQLAAFGKPGRDPRGRMITIVFWGICCFDQCREKTRAGDDAAIARWFNIEDLGDLKWSFDHKDVVDLGIKKLKNTAEYRVFLENKLGK